MNIRLQFFSPDDVLLNTVILYNAGDSQEELDKPRGRSAQIPGGTAWVEADLVS